MRAVNITRDVVRVMSHGARVMSVSTKRERESGGLKKEMKEKKLLLFVDGETSHVSQLQHTPPSLQSTAIRS